MTRRRLRLVFAAVAVALAVPTALLVQRALRGVAAESEARHRAVAERLFDEMERLLSDFVTREEARPVEAWSAAGPSVLAALPDEPFVVGYFQVEPDGSVTLPLAARDESALRAATARVLANAAVSPAAPAPAAAAPPPGVTVALDERKDEALRALGYRVAQEKSRDAELAESAESPYDALQSLNRGARPRAERRQKVVERFSEPPLGRVVRAPEPQSGTAPAGTPADRPRAPEGFADVEEADTPVHATGDAHAERELPEALADASAGGAASPAEPAPGRERTLRLFVDPLVGRPSGEGHLVLVRSVFTDTVALRQGLVLDAEALGTWLREQGLGAARLAGATLSFAADASAAPAPALAYAYRHRFAEPFDSLDAMLELPPLGRSGGAANIYALSALLVLAATAGLVAIYRMVSAALGFAERRSNFAASVTHELRTPLTAIRMHGEMLRDGLVRSEAKRRESYAAITAESERLTRLVDDVLELSRLERGGRAMRLESGAPGSLIAALAEPLRVHAERAGFSLRVEIDPELPPVRFERDALQQVLVNLVDNAIKYASGAEPREIAISCRRVPPGVLLAVRDHGPGVPARLRERIFEPFHRAGDELTRSTRGTGLGLALVRSLVERMGGAVTAAAAAGGGLEVRVTLPAVESAARGAVAAPPPRG